MFKNPHMKKTKRMQYFYIQTNITRTTHQLEALFETLKTQTVGGVKL